MTLALLGVGIGLLAAFALTRVMSSLLFGVSAADPISFLGVSILLAAVALLACYIRRGARLESIRWWHCDMNKQPSTTVSIQLTVMKLRPIDPCQSRATH